MHPHKKQVFEHTHKEADVLKGPSRDRDVPLSTHKDVQVSAEHTHKEADVL